LAFAAAAVGIVNIFNPSRIVVGGSVAQGQGERLLDPARAAIARHSYGSAARAIRVVLGSLGDVAGLAGCVPLVAALMTDAT
jgi:predicted NBD/HSP70 family sugar kinase